MKKNLISIILYFLGVIALLAVFIILEQPFLLLVILPFIAVPFFTSMVFFHAIKKISFQAYGQTPYVELGNPVIFCLEGKNDSVFSLFNCTVSFKAENLFTPNSNEQLLSVPLHARQKNVFEIPLETTIPGLLSLDFKHVQVSDYLHFFTITVPLNKVAQIPVLPLKLKATIPEQTASAEGEEEVEDAPHGMPSTDIKEIREYRPGDRLQRVHWKLSAKLDDLFVKEMANTSVLSLVILPEMTRDSITETAGCLRTLLEQLIEEEVRFELCLYNHTLCEFQNILITSKDDFMDSFIRFYYLPLYDERDLAKEAFFASMSLGHSMLHIFGKNIEYISCS